MPSTPLVLSADQCADLETRVRSGALVRLLRGARVDVRYANRAMLARISSALLVEINGFGSRDGPR
jgi:hypothetical protein